MYAIHMSGWRRKFTALVGAVLIVGAGVIVGVRGSAGRPAHWAAYTRRMGSPTTGAGTVDLFAPDGNVNMRVSMFLVGTGWIDITSSVRGNDGVEWTRGRPDGQQKDTPGTLRFSLNNRDGVFSPRNPSSPYYGKLGRNTPVQFALGDQVEWSGEFSSLPQRWDVSGQDRWVPVTAAGIRRRLGQGQKPLRSPLYRTLTRTADVAEYWPMDDTAGSTQAVNGLPGHAPLSGSGSYGSVSGFPSNTRSYIETVSGTGYVIPPSTSQLRSMTSGSWTVDHWFKLNVTDPATIGIDVVTMRWTTSGTQYSWFTSINRSVIDGSTGAILGSQYLGSESGSGFMINELTPAGVDPFDGQWHMMRASAVQNSSTSFTMTLYLDGQLVGTTTNTNPPSGVAGNEVGRIIKAQAGGWSPNAGIATNVSSVGVGELTLWTSATPSLSAATVYAIGRGYAGETAGRRCERLCAEQSIPFTPFGDLDVSFAVGPQTTDEVLDLLDLSATSDASRLVEPRHMLGLAYLSRAGRYNPSGLVISHADGIISPPFQPVDDDDNPVNDVTVTNVRGSSAQVTKTSGAFNVNPPGADDPEAVGQYDATKTVTVQDESLLAQLAGWAVHEGTWDEARWPAVTFELHRSEIRNDPVLLAAIRALDIGSMITVTDPPAGLPPENVELVVEGIEGRADNKTVTLTFNCSPGGIRRVGVFNADATRYESSGTWLTTAVGAGDTALTVRSTGPRWVVPTDTAYSVPFDIMVAGERMRVTATSQSVTDAFARTVANGWGSADTGQAYTRSGGSSADFSVGSGVGSFSLATVTSDYLCTVDTSGDDHEVVMDLRFPTLPATNTLRAGAAIRVVDSSNFLHAEMRVGTAGDVTLDIRSRIGGVATSIAALNLPTTYIANTWWKVRARSEGNTLSMSAYPTAGPVPASWQLTTSTSALSSGTRVGVFGRNDSALTRTVEFDNLVVNNPQGFTVTRSINGIVKSHTVGTEVRLYRPARYAL